MCFCNIIHASFANTILRSAIYSPLFFCALFLHPLICINRELQRMGDDYLRWPSCHSTCRCNCWWCWLRLCPSWLLTKPIWEGWRRIWMQWRRRKAVDEQQRMSLPYQWGGGASAWLALAWLLSLPLVFCKLIFLFSHQKEMRSRIQCIQFLYRDYNVFGVST